MSTPPVNAIRMAFRWRADSGPCWASDADLAYRAFDYTMPHFTDHFLTFWLNCCICSAKVKQSYRDFDKMLNSESIHPEMEHCQKLSFCVFVQGSIKIKNIDLSKIHPLNA